MPNPKQKEQLRRDALPSHEEIGKDEIMLLHINVASIRHHVARCRGFINRRMKHHSYENKYASNERAALHKPGPYRCSLLWPAN
jgi:hypothetical protein